MKFGSLVKICSLLLILSVQIILAQQIPLAGNAIPKYLDPVPTFVGARVDGTQPLTISMEETQQVVLPSAFLNPATGLPYYTTVWAYSIDDGSNIYGPLYPAYTIEAQQGIPTTVTYLNNLSSPTAPFYRNAVDQTLHWADPLMQYPSFLTPYSGPIPAVVHLHGGEVPSAYDGGPDAWFTTDGVTGPGYVTNVFEYPNDQLGATLWYHDHALGVTRLNVYAGMAGFYLLRDAVDTGIPGSGANLPAGNYEIEIAIQDRMFDTNGELFYPVGGQNPAIHPIWQPEFFGDVIVVNGKTWPYLEVEPRRYRFRLLDGSNSRFYEMWLQNQATGAMGPAFWQIGTDGGLLDFPVQIDPALGSFLVMGPGERADIIIDFSGLAGQTFTLRNKARSPFPKGAPADPQTTGQIMQFRVVKPLIGTDNSYNPASGALIRPLTKLVNFATATPAVPVDQKRLLTLNEVMGVAGPVEALLNNSKWDGRESPNTGNGTHPGEFFTEMPMEGSTEVWQIVNLTGDAHPIHLHLVQFQLISRQKYNVSKYTKAYDVAFPAVANWFDPMTGMMMNYPGGVYVPSYGPPTPYSTVNADGAIGGNPAISRYLQGPVKPANPNERGWKDTFIMYPGEVTTVIVRFSPQTSDQANSTPYFAFDPSAGPGYVWHCHILEHEDNEMMRPYRVMATGPAGRPAPGAGLDYPGPMHHGMMAQKEAGAFGTIEEVNPENFNLSQNYPNPFNPTTQISFQLPEVGEVRLSIYNTLGQEVRTLADGSYEKGFHNVTWDATDNFGNRVASGIYLYRIESGSFVQQKKMMLLK